MKFSSAALLFSLLCSFTAAFVQQQQQQRHYKPLFVSIGLGPDQKKDDDQRELVAGVDYEVPDHEEYRLSRRSKLDEQADLWFQDLLQTQNHGILGQLADQAKKILSTPVPLVNEIEKPVDDEEWTPYVNTRLPWTPLVPAYGLEQFGLPVPRRNADTWRHFDVATMIQQNYAGRMESNNNLELSDDTVQDYQQKLEQAGGWLDDSACAARLVYINGRFTPQLSKTSDNMAVNLSEMPKDDDFAQTCLARLTDGFTDELVVGVPNNDQMQTSYKKLSGPNHNLGEPTSQFAINSQQGTACFAALNTIKTGAVAYIHAPEGMKESKPVLIVNAVTKSGDGIDLQDDQGVSCHPRTLVVAEEKSRLSVVQSCVDLDNSSDHVPKLYNGYTQVFVKAEANVTHSYLEESGGMVTAGVEKSDDEFEESETKPREMESQREELKDTHLEAIDVHIMGENGDYEGTVMSIGGSGRVRIAMSVSLLRTGAHASVNGFSLSGGAQRTDMKTNIHHIAQGTTSEQVQKNMIGGRATGAFRGRIRVEQSAQQTDSQQLSRTVLLSDRARAWAVPSLEIIADDVQCTHGATVSDLSEEELFYLRSRGLGVTQARNLLMYAFVGDVSESVDPTMLGNVDSKRGLQQRIIQRLENLVPQGERAVKGEFQSI